MLSILIPLIVYASQCWTIVETLTGRVCTSCCMNGLCTLTCVGG